MKLAGIFVITLGIGVLSYPVMKFPHGGTFFADGGEKQAEPIPIPTRTEKTDFAQVDSPYGPKNYHIVINIPATKLILYEDENPVMDFPIAVGQIIYKTPVGPQEIRELIWNPWWYPPNSDWAKNEKITPPGPRNPLGPVKLPMSDEIRLHGTTKDWSIGRAASHGCIRMHSGDAVTLAWYLQRNLSEQSAPAFLEKYKKFGSTTFHVKLDRPVPVDIVYDAVAFNEDTITIYPDLYGIVRDIKDIVKWRLFTSGIDPWALDLSSISKPKLASSQVSIYDLQ